MMKRKILIATFTFAPNKDGVACAATSLALDLLSQGYEIVVCTETNVERKEMILDPNIRVEEFRLGISANLKDCSPHESLRMQELIMSEKPDVIICQCWDVSYTAIAELTFPHLPDSRKVIISHGYSSLWKPSSRFPWGIKGLLRGLFKLCFFPRTIHKYDRVVFTAKKMDFHRFLDHTIAKMIRFKGIKIIPNSIIMPENKLPSEKLEKLRDGQDLVVMCVSNYYPGKNQELALRAFRCASIKNSLMIFIGSSFNDYSDYLMKVDAEISKKTKSGRVLFLEGFSRDETLAAYNMADIFLFTSLSETGPLVVLEALAAGVPFVSTRVGIVDQLPGGIVVMGKKKIARALKLLANNSIKRKQMGAQGREHVKNNFCSVKIRENRIQMIRELLDVQRGA